MSPAAVSLALRNKPGVSLATRQRIQALAAEYAYQIPAPVHAGLRGQYPTVGYIALSLESQGFVQVLRGILDVGFRESVRVVPLQLHEETARDISLAIEVLVEQGIDGLLLFCPLGQKIPPPVYYELISREIAVVCIDHVPASLPLDCVASDGAAAAWMMVEYLYELGHREVGILRFAPEDTHITTMMEAAKRYGMTARYVLLENSGMPEDMQAAFQLPGPLPTAFLCHNDYVAGYLLQLARRNGLRVPDALSIVGYGNYVLSKFCNPPLTTVELTYSEIGRQALSLLLKRIQERLPVGQYTPETVRIAPALLPRESCAPPPFPRRR